MTLITGPQHRVAVRLISLILLLLGFRGHFLLCRLEVQSTKFLRKSNHNEIIGGHFSLSLSLSLYIYIKKTKVLVFCKAGKHISQKFLYGNQELECVSRYKYLYLQVQCRYSIYFLSIIFICLNRFISKSS
jgi:hypothetical protein